jgi:molybdopterin converting factor subunit 1
LLALLGGVSVRESDGRLIMENAAAAAAVATDVEVEYFAVLRERAGVTRERISTTSPTLADLYEELRLRHRFPLERGSLRVAVGDAFADWQDPLAPGDKIAFIPPVAGG